MAKNVQVLIPWSAVDVKWIAKAGSKFTEGAEKVNCGRVSVKYYKKKGDSYKNRPLFQGMKTNRPEEKF